jgi:hypothetical protein
LICHDFISRAAAMAFLIYFFVLLMIGTSVLFGLDWVNAPLHPPAQQERTQAAGAQKAEHAARQKPQVLIGRVEPRAPAAKLETTGQSAGPEQRAAETVAAARAKPMQAETPLAQSKPEAVAQQHVRAQKTAKAPEPEKPVVSAQQSKPEPVASAPQGKPEPVAKAAPSTPEPVAQQQPEPKAASSEKIATQATADSSKPEKKRNVARHQPAQPAASARSRSARRDTRGEPDARVPEWALRGAEAAEREPRYEHRGAAPAWAIEGAPRREAEREPEPRPHYLPFWQSASGWPFR